jgi:hypothetical protein
MTRRLAVLVAVVLVPLLAYPLVTLAGGWPRFPSQNECVHAVVEGSPVDIVYGRFDSVADADELRDRVVAVGLTGTEVAADGCGRFKVVYENVPSVEVAQQVQEEARKVGFESTLERAAAG